VLTEIVPGNDMTVPERPFAAVCHSLSMGAAEVWPTAKLREAVRASLMPPGILPPLITENGAILLSGEAETKALCHAVNALTASPVFFLHAKPAALGNVEKPHRYLSGSPFRLGALQLSATGRVPGLDAIFAALPGQATVALDASNHFSISIPAGIGPLDWSEWTSLREIGFEWTSSELTKRR
jgi:NTE family protein